MASKSKELSDLQRDLLQTALRSSKGKIWLPKAAAQSFPTTYAALASLQRRKLMDLEPGKDSDVLTWKITKEGKEAVVPPKVVRAPPEKVTTPPKAPAEPLRREVSAKSAPKATPAAKPIAPPKHAAKSAARAAPSPKARSAPPAAEAPRSRGGKGKQAVPPAKPAAGAAKKGAAAKSGGRGRT